MLDFNVITAVAVGVALVVLIRFVFPLYKDRASIYKDVKTALLLFGYAFRDDKIKAITDMIFNIVSVVEELDKSSITKQYEAMTQAYDALLAEFDIVLDPDIIQLLVDIAVAYLPKTGKGEINE